MLSQTEQIKQEYEVVLLELMKDPYIVSRIRQIQLKNGIKT